MQSSYNNLITKLNIFIKEYYKNLIVRGVVYSLIFLGLLLIIIAVAEHIVFFDKNIRIVFFWTYCFLGILISTKYIFSPLIKMLRLSNSTLSHEDAAKIIGEHFDEVADKLTNILELRSLDAGNQALIKASIEQKTKAIRLTQFNRAVDWQKTINYSGYLVFPFLIILAFFISGNKNIISESANRIVNYNMEFEKPAPFYFNIVNDNFNCLENEDFIISLNTSGEQLPINVFIHYNGTKHKMAKKSVNSFQYTMRNVVKNTSFFFSANGRQSKPYTIETLDRPIISNLNIKVSPPAYTMIPPKTIINMGTISVPEGSDVSWTITSESADSLFFNLGSIGEYVKKENNQFFIKKNIRKSSNYAISLSNNNAQYKDTVFYNIQAITDTYPSISISTEPSKDSLLFLFQVLINDDYGFKDLTLNKRIYGLDRDTLIHKKIDISLSSRSQILLSNILINEVGLIPGESVDMFFVVRDNDKINNYKSSNSKTISYNSKSRAQYEEEYDQINEEIKSTLKDEMASIKELQKELQEFEKQLIEKDSLDWRDKKTLTDILQKQQNLDQKIEELSKLAKENFEKINSLTTPNENIIEKQLELQKLFEDILPDELRALYEELNKLKEELNKDDLQKKIQELQLSNEDIEKELDRNLEMLRRFEFDEKLDKLIEDLNKLSNDQLKLSENKTDKNPKSLHKKNIEKFKKIKEDISELKELNNSLENKQQIVDTKQDESKIDDMMKDAENKLDRGNKKSAKKSQKKTSELLNSLEQKFLTMKQENKEAQQEEDMDALRQVLENLVYFSLEEESIFMGFDRTDENDPQYIDLMHEQQALINSAKIIEDSLFALSKRVPQISSKVNQEINAIKKKSASTADYLRERQTEQAIESQQFIMVSANNLAVLLFSILEQMQQDLSSEMPNNQQCEKPGKGSPKPGDLKKMQQSLSEHLNQLREEIKNGKKNQNKDGNNSKKLVEMIAKQEIIRQSLQKLKGGMEDKDGLKSIEDAINKMEQNEKDIANNRITQELISRQAEITTRMLEIERALKEQGEDTKRESQTATDYERIMENTLKKYEQQKIKQIEMLNSVPPSLKEYYKEKTNRYFNLIL